MSKYNSRYSKSQGFESKERESKIFSPARAGDSILRGVLEQALPLSYLEGKVKREGYPSLSRAVRDYEEGEELEFYFMERDFENFLNALDRYSDDDVISLCEGKGKNFLLLILTEISRQENGETDGNKG